MNRAYVPDNTRSSMVIVLSLALAVGLIAALLGLSDKPDVDALAVSTERAVAGAPAESLGTAGGVDESVATLELDELGNPILDGDASSALAVDDETVEDSDLASSAAPAEGAEIQEEAEAPVAIPAASPEPEPTPEVAAAVEPTPAPTTEPAPEPTAAPLAGDTAADAGEIEAGSVEGKFFTRPDEDEGATVAQNLVEVSFNEDGTGNFTGILDITYANETRIYLEMSGPLVWTSGNPQVKATVTGTYGFDAVIDADDVASTEGELSITSLESGSGSLCAPKCFGFTFPQQRRL